MTSWSFASFPTGVEDVAIFFFAHVRKRLLPGFFGLTSCQLHFFEYSDSRSDFAILSRLSTISFPTLSYDFLWRSSETYTFD